MTPRHQRDYPRLLGLIKGHALLNYANREKIPDREGCIFANQSDIDEGFRLYELISKANELGISPRLHEIFSKVFLSKDDGEALDRIYILTKYRDVFHRSLSPHQLDREIIPDLEASGLIKKEPDPEDRRKMLFYPTHTNNISPENNKRNTESIGGGKF